MKWKEKQKVSPSFLDDGCIFTHATFFSKYCMYVCFMEEQL